MAVTSESKFRPLGRVWKTSLVMVMPLAVLLTSIWATWPVMVTTSLRLPSFISIFRLRVCSSASLMSSRTTVWKPSRLKTTL